MDKRKQWILFGAAVLLQVLIVAAVPARKIVAHATGRTAILRVAPVDPYNILSGYYVALSYDISRASAFPGAPGLVDGEVVYAVVEEAEGAWRPISLERARPTGLPRNRVAIRGVAWGAATIQYGIEEFYVPEGEGRRIEDDIRANPGAARAEVKVDPWGNAALVGLRVHDRVYR